MSATPSRSRVILGKQVGRVFYGAGLGGEGVGVFRLSGLDPRVQVLLGVHLIERSGSVALMPWAPEDLLTFSVYAQVPGCNGVDAVYGPIPGYVDIPIVPSVVTEDVGAGPVTVFKTNMVGVETKTSATDLIAVVKYSGGVPDPAFLDLCLFSSAVVSMENGEDEEDGNEILSRINLSVDRSFDRSYGGGE